MTECKTCHNKKAVISAGLVAVILIMLTLLPAAGCGSSDNFQVVERSYSDDPGNISIGIVSKTNLVSSSGTASIDENKQRILEIIDLAKEYGVNMVLFPEFSLTGYFWGDTPECWDYMKEGVTNNYPDWLSEVKSRLDDQLQYVVFNNIRLDPDDPQGKFLNSTYIIDDTFDCSNLNSESNEEFHIYDIYMIRHSCRALKKPSPGRERPIP